MMILAVMGAKIIILDRMLSVKFIHSTTQPRISIHRRRMPLTLRTSRALVTLSSKSLHSHFQYSIDAEL